MGCEARLEKTFTRFDKKLSLFYVRYKQQTSIGRVTDKVFAHLVFIINYAFMSNRLQVAEKVSAYYTPKNPQLNNQRHWESQVG